MAKTETLHRVPPGVLHTPRRVGQTLSGKWDNRGTPWDKTPETCTTHRGVWDTFVGHRGTTSVPFAEKAWDTGPK